jgi:hypothetical protein
VLGVAVPSPAHSLGSSCPWASWLQMWKWINVFYFQLWDSHASLGSSYVIIIKAVSHGWFSTDSMKNLKIS